MNYVIAGYCAVLGILFLYGVNLLWRRRRLTRTVARVAVGRADREGASEGANEDADRPPIDVVGTEVG